MPYEKCGTLKLSKSTKAILVFFDDGRHQPISVSVSSVKEVLDGKRVATDVSRIVQDEQGTQNSES
ncbi:MAG: hypothetical protein ACE14S_10330 [Candidatus Bathyarchaeia archaeon]